MSWGIKITILYLSFVVMIVTMVVLTSRENIDLEYKDYYARELAYQDKIDAMANEKALPQSIQHQVQDKALVLIAPMDFILNGIKGDLHFYRPSDATKDLILPMAFDGKGQQIISRTVFSKGMYKLRMSWNLHEKQYFKEVVLNL
ncbi:MAG: FixH family protein [Bacteroidia bacterium]|jgi:hypothetical protein|nr:FixH family protein [Bacteroidia bacterium]